MPATSTSAFGYATGKKGAGMLSVAGSRVVVCIFLMSLLVTACGGESGEADQAGGGDGDGQAQEPEATEEPQEQDEAEATEPMGETGSEDGAGEGDDEQEALAEFYGGKTITLVVGSSPGGGFDTYARLIARHMGKYVPGEPEVIVENMPGAGHTLAMNHLYNVAPRDGTVIGNATGALSINQLFEADTVDYDMTKINYLGQPDPQGVNTVIVRTAAGIEHFDQLVGDNPDQLVIGTSAPGSLQHDPAVLLRDVVGANVQVVPGYPGTADMALAMDQGETDAFMTNYHSAIASSADRFESGEWAFLAQFAPEDGLHPELPDVATPYSYVDSDEDLALLRFGGGESRSLLRIYFTPPEVPEERVRALQEAFRLALEDPELLAEAEQGDIAIEYISGEQVAAGINDFLSMPEGVRERLREVLQP